MKTESPFAARSMIMRLLARIFPRPAALLPIVLCLCLSGTAAATEPRILLLHSYHPGMKWVDDITAAVRNVMRQENSRAQLFIEYMDGKRIADAEHLANLARLYRHKFAAHPFDIIISADDIALRFLLQHRDEISPGSPVVFCGVNNFDDEMLSGHGGFTGILEDVDVAGTLQLALQLHPQTRQIYIINDETETGQGLHRKIALATVPYRDRLEFIFLEHYAVSELVDIVAKLPPDALVLRSAFFLDRNGIPLADEKIATELIDRHIRVPIYTLWDFYLGHGVVGGHLVSGTAQGELAARLATRILGGEAAATIPVVRQSPNRYLFDDRQLRRFDLDADRLPAESQIFYQSPAFYRVNKTLIWVVTLVAAGLIASGVGFGLYQRRQRRISELLHRAEARFRTLFDASGDPVFIVHTDGRLCEVNQRACEQLGYTHDELLTRSVTEIDIQTSRAAFKAMLDRMEQDENLIFTTRHRRKDGTTYPVEINCRAIDYNRNRCIIATARDLSEREAAAQALRQSDLRLQERERMLALVINAVPQMIYWKDHSSVYLGCNNAFAAAAGLAQAEEIVGRRDSDLPLLPVPLRQPPGSAGQAGYQLIESRSGEGQATWYSYGRLPLCDEEDQIVATLGIIDNITEQREMDRLKDEMLSMVSHEMRTPLTAMMGYTTYILENDVPPAQLRDFLATMLHETERLEELISNFLDLQRLRLKQQQQRHSLFFLAPLLHEVVALYRSSSPRHAVLLAPLPELPPLLGNEEQLGQVFKNLLSNAVKYSPDGGEIVTAAICTAGEVIVSVTDQGMGIPQEVLEKIFDRFYRVDNSDRRLIGGTGLGLALVREIVHAHGGRVWVESSPDAGSAFFVALPIPAAEPLGRCATG